MTASILPLAKTQFLDPQGNPLAGGSVAFYVPGTTTPKNTWQDAAQTTLNTNPVILDTAGEALIYGVGQYRQVVKDALGNLIWDQLTQDNLSLSSYITCAASGTNAITLTPGSSVSAYSNLQTYVFTAPNTSTGAVTVQIGSLGFLPLYMPTGVQAGSVSTAVQDIVQGSVYVITYGSALNGGAGGFQVVGGPQAQWLAAPSRVFNPTGNTPTTLGTMVVQANSSATAERQFLGSFNFFSNTNFGVSGADHAALYTSVVADAGSSNVWSINPLIELGAGASTSISGQGIELDFNNNNANRGATVGPTSINPPVAYGLAVSGASAFSSTSAIVVSGVTTNQWYRGITFTGSEVYSAISDYSSATYGIEMIANHSIGIDMNGSSQPTALRTGNSQAISSRNAAGSSDVNIAVVDGANNLVLGAGSAFIIMENTTNPAADNAFTCGANGARWSAIWAANGTIQTSDPSLKTDIQPLPSAMPIISAVKPVTFKWIDGGSKMEPVQVTKEIQDTTSVEMDVPDVQMVNGKAVATTRKVVKDEPVFDEVPVFDDAGNQIFDTLPAKAPILDKLGNVLRAAIPEQKVARTHRIPRMVTKTFTEMQPVSHAGQRTHWGFLASDVKAAFDAIGMDFGGYVKGDNGVEALRPDQLIPVLWKAVQELSADVSALKAKVGI